MSQTKAQLIDTLVASLLPASDSSVDIGSNAVRFANIYGDTLYGNGANLTGINTDLVSDTSPQLGGPLNTNGQIIKWPDSNGTTVNRAVFGAGDDLMIYHNGSDSVIREQGTGNLDIQTTGGNVDILVNTTEHAAKFISDGAVELYYDSSKKFETTSTGATLTGALTATGAIFTSGVTFTGASYNTNWVSSANTMRFYDNAKAGFGSSDDLQIYHDSANSLIDEVGTGILGLRSDTGINLYKLTGNEFMLKAIPDGAVELYHNNSKKFETTSGGVLATGDFDSTTGIFERTTGFTSQLKFTDSNETKLVHGSNGQVLLSFVGTGNAARGSIDGQSGFIRIKTATGDTGVICRDNSSTDLRFDDSTKLETTSVGAKVTGRLGIDKAPRLQELNAKLSVFAATGNDDASDWGADGIFQLDSLKVLAAANNEVLLLGAVSGAVGQIASGFGFGRESTSNWGTYHKF